MIQPSSEELAVAPEGPVELAGVAGVWTSAKTRRTKRGDPGPSHHDATPTTGLEPRRTRASMKHLALQLQGTTRIPVPLETAELACHGHGHGRLLGRQHSGILLNRSG